MASGQVSAKCGCSQPARFILLSSRSEAYPDKDLLDSSRPVGIYPNPLSQAPIIDFMEIPVTRGSNDMARCIVGRIVGCDIYHIGKADQRGLSKYLLRSVGVVVQLPAGL